MIRKLGLEIETAAPDEASFDEFHTAFKEPLSPSTHEAFECVVLPNTTLHQLLKKLLEIRL
jgi:hypothetical protein